MREPALPVPPRSFDEPAAQPARRRALPVTPRHVFLDELGVDPAAGRVTGCVHHTLQARHAGVRRLPFDAADLEVTGAWLGEAALEVVPHAQGVDVVLPRALAAGEEITVRLRFEAWPTAGLYCVTGPRGPQSWTQGAMEDHHHWFPCFDAPEHLVTTELRAVAPPGCVALSNGRLLAHEVLADGASRWHWRHDTPHALYLLTFVVDQLVELVRQHGAVGLHDWVPADRAADAAAAFARLPQMLDFFAQATGRPYPYPRYGHVFLKDFMWGGMENTTLTSLTDRCLVPAELLEEAEVERLVAHELAHQWFGDLIAPRGWPELWLNESFATYFEILCMGALEGEDDFARRLLDQRDAYLAEARERYARPVVSRRYAHPYVLFDRHAYEKGSLLLHTLRDQLGDAAFWQGIARYVQQAAGTAASSEDLRRCFEEVSGEDLSDFFELLVGTAAHPRVRVRWIFDRRAGLEVSLERQDETEQQLYVRLAVRAAGATTTWPVRLAPGTRTLVLPLATPPEWVALDPAQACLVEVDESLESDAALQARMAPAQTPALLRVRTARELGRRGSAPNTACLARALAEDPSPMVRAEAATALGAHRQAPARAALRAAAAEASGQGWRVRAAAARALGVGAPAADVPGLEALLDAEPRYRVRCALLGALGDIREPAARERLTAWLDQARGPAADREQAAALAALAAHEHADGLPAILTRLGPDTLPRVRAAALAALGRLLKADRISDKAQARALRERIEATLLDPDFQARVAATQQLAQLGAAQSAEALRRAHGAEPFAFLRRLHREALGRLRPEG